MPSNHLLTFPSHYYHRLCSIMSAIENKSASHLGVPTQHLSKLNSAHSSDLSLHRVQNHPGYNTPVFKGKEEQRALVEQAVAAKVCPNSPT